MSVDREAVLEAIERYLPSAVNFSRSTDLGELARDAVFARLKKLLLTALLLDADAIFYVVYMTVRQLVGALDSAITAFEQLESEEQLRGVVPTTPTRMETGQLQDVQLALLQLSDDLLVTNVFGTTALSSYQSSMETFLADQVVPNMVNRSRASVSADLRSTMEVLAVAWAHILELREVMQGVHAGYLANDLRTLVSSDIITAVRAQLQELEATLPGLSTDDQAALAEQFLIESAAAEAALLTIGEAPNTTGTIICVGDDGATDLDYLAYEGTASVVPLNTVLSGDDGELAPDVQHHSETGHTVDSGGTLTYEFEDAATPDLTTIASAGQYIVFADSGRVHKIESVTPLIITLETQTLHVVAAQRYLIVTHLPAQRFTSTEAFCSAHAGGYTEADIIVDGVAGAFIRDDKTTGVDGTNVKVSGTGYGRPYLSTGIGDFTAADTFECIGATFLSDGVWAGEVLVIDTPGDPNGNNGTWTVTDVPDEEHLTILGPANVGVGDDFWVEYADAEGRFQIVGATLLSDGVVAGDVLSVLTGTAIGDYAIDTVLGQEDIRVTTTPFGTRGAGDFEILYAADEFVSTTAEFLSNQVLVGDTLDISGVGTFTISVVEEDKLTLSAPLGASLTGESFAVYESAVTTRKFYTTDPVLLETLGVGALIAVTEDFAGTTHTVYRPGLLRVGGVSYDIAYLDPDSPEDTVYVSTDVAITLPGAWDVTAGDETRTLKDASAPFIADMEGTPLHFDVGGLSLLLAIDAVVATDEVRLSGLVPADLAAVLYHIHSPVTAGMLLFTTTCNEVNAVLGPNTLEVTPALRSDFGEDVVYHVLLAGASAVSSVLQDPTVTPSVDWVGAPIDYLSKTGTVTAVLDLDLDGTLDAFEVDDSLPLTLRNVPFLVRVYDAGAAEALSTSALGSSSAVADDYLTIWGLPGVFEVVSVTAGPPTMLFVDPFLPSDYSGQDFIIVRGGPLEYGRHQLLLTKDAEITLDTEMSLLRLHIAEVLLDLGAVAVTIVSGAGGIVEDTGSSGGTSGWFYVATAPFASVRVGDRLTVDDGTSQEVTYVTKVSSTSELEVFPELTVATGLVWTVERTSVSAALNESTRLRQQLEALREVLNTYEVPTNTTLTAVLDLFTSQRMDRAADLLYEGEIEALVNLTQEESNYAALARSSVQEVGRSAVPSEATYNQAVGINPLTGQRVEADTRATSQYTAGALYDLRSHTELARGIRRMHTEERMGIAAAMSMEERLCRALYTLTGEIESALITDTDDTLPWVAVTGSTRDRLLARKNALLETIQYMIDHPEEFTEPGETE